MRMMFRIRLFIWSVWMRMPKPWLKRNYQKDIERMQPAVKRRKRKRTRLITISQKKPVTGSQRGTVTNVFSVSLVNTWIKADQKCS